MKYPKDKMYEQVVATALKSRKIAANTEFTAVAVVPGTIKQGNREVTNDTLIVATNTGSQVRVPMRELAKMRTAEGKEAFTSVENENSVVIPDKFKVVNSTDRKDRNGNTVFPIQAYKLGQELLDGKITGWDKVVEGGLKEDNKLEAVQDYIIAVL